MNKTFFFLLPLLILAGCISPKSYVDPAYRKSSYDDVKPVANKYDTEIVVEFQRNGETLPKVHKEVVNAVERTFRASGIINPVKQDSDITIKVVINNIADLGSAMSKGFGTGLTFGAIGTLVTDYYEVKVTYSDHNGVVLTKSYQHALHTTIGNKASPFPGLEPTSMGDAFSIIIDEVLLNFIVEMQSNNLLSYIPSAALHRT